MEKLYFPDEVAARYRVTERTAKSYMRKMRHMTKPLAVTESALFAYEQGRTVDPAAPVTRKQKSAAWQAAPVVTHIPRRKEIKRG